MLIDFIDLNTTDGLKFKDYNCLKNAQNAKIQQKCQNTYVFSMYFF